MQLYRTLWWLCMSGFGKWISDKVIFKNICINIIWSWFRLKFSKSVTKMHKIFKNNFNVKMCSLFTPSPQVDETDVQVLDVNMVI